MTSVKKIDAEEALKAFIAKMMHEARISTGSISAPSMIGKIDKINTPLPEQPTFPSSRRVVAAVPLHFVETPIKPSKGESESMNTDNIFRKITALFLLAMSCVFSFYTARYYSGDTPVNRAQIELKSMETQRQLAEAQAKVKQAEELTKQMKIALRSGIPIPMPAIPTVSPRAIQVQEGQQWIVTKEFNFVIPSSRSPDQPVATLLFKDIPKSITGGEYMFVYRGDPTKRAWSSGWSHKQSPNDVTSFLSEHRQLPGGSQYIEIYSKGQVQLNM